MSSWSPDLIARAHGALTVDGLPDANGNARPADGDGDGIDFNSVADMAVFDALPPMARYALNYADLSYCSSQVVLMAVAKGIEPADAGGRLVMKVALPSKEKPDVFTWRDAPVRAAREGGTARALAPGYRRCRPPQLRGFR